MPPGLIPVREESRRLFRPQLFVNIRRVLPGRPVADQSSLLADDNRFGQAVVRALVIGVEEVLQEAEAALQGGGAVTEAALHRLPKREAVVSERDDADSQ